MLPLMKSGDYAVLLTWPFFLPKPGMKVVFEHSLYGTLIKTVVAVQRVRREFSAKGLNPLSVSADKLENMPLSCIKGRVIWHIAGKA